MNLAKRDESHLLSDRVSDLNWCCHGIDRSFRPASGAEHMLSHYWEMAVIAAGKNPELHGIKVGIATPIIAKIFDEMKDTLPESVFKIAPSAKYAAQLLRDVNAPINPQDAGIDKDLFYRSILEGNTVRERYSILDYAVKHVILKNC